MSRKKVSILTLREGDRFIFPNDTIECEVVSYDTKLDWVFYRYLTEKHGYGDMGTFDSGDEDQVVFKL